jgi:hypothetical protein
MRNNRKLLSLNVEASRDNDKMYFRSLHSYWRYCDCKQGCGLQRSKTQQRITHVFCVFGVPRWWSCYLKTMYQLLWLCGIEGFIGKLLWHVHPSSSNDSEISIQQPLLCNGTAKTAVDIQWLSSDHAITPTEINATIALQQRYDIFYAVRAEML